MTELRDGDIYRWRWADEEKDRGCGPFSAYHCCSMMAVVQSGKLVDTYWGSLGDNKVLRPEEVILTYLGNANDMTEIRSWDIPYYRREDIVDMRHPNNPNGTIYLQPGAVKSAEAMRTEAENRRNEAVRMRDSAERWIKEMDEVLNLIEQGKLDEVFF